MSRFLILPGPVWAVEAVAGTPDPEATPAAAAWAKRSPVRQSLPRPEPTHPAVANVLKQFNLQAKATACCLIQANLPLPSKKSCCIRALRMARFRHHSCSPHQTESKVSRRLHPFVTKETRNAAKQDKTPTLVTWVTECMLSTARGWPSVDMDTAQRRRSTWQTRQRRTG